MKVADAEMVDIRRCVERACRSEAEAPKPGNVHPGASFTDLTFEDFVQAGKEVAPVMEVAPGRPIGQTILDAVKRTRQRTSTNVNLGIVILFAPICAAVRDGVSQRSDVERILTSLTVSDAHLTYEAIRVANPGGLGKAEEQDVADPPTVTLLEAMKLASGRDAVARQYVNGFADVFELGCPVYDEASQVARVSTLEATVWCHLRLMAAFPDSLIARKCGDECAREAQRRAKSVVEQLTNHRGEHGPMPRAGFFDTEPVHMLDRWLREDGNRRNPGATADLVAASLLVAFLNETG